MPADVEDIVVEWSSLPRIVTKDAGDVSRVTKSGGHIDRVVKSGGSVNEVMKPDAV